MRATSSSRSTSEGARAEVAVRERVERNLHHSSQRSPISRNPSTRSWRVSRSTASFVSFAIVHGLVADPLEVDRVVEDGERKSEIAGDGGLKGERLLEELLDPVIARVDLVVEGDHLVTQVCVLGFESVESAAQRAEDDLALLLEARLQALQALPLLEPHPNLPVTSSSVRLSDSWVKIFDVGSCSTRIPLPALAVVMHFDREERRHVCDAGRLLHIVRHDDDRVLALQVVHEILDPRCRDRVERRRRLVHQDDVRLGGERARDAEPLLLAAGEPERGVFEAVLDLVPERGPAQAALDTVVEIVLHPERARAEGDVVVDRLRERVRLLEDHADPAAHFDRVDVRAYRSLP